MNQPTARSPRLAPLPTDHTAELKDEFASTAKSMGFIPNSMLIMQRKPKLVKAIRQLSAAVFDAEGEVSVGFKRLLAYVVARTHGCHY
jgi:hypothetical protein